MRPSPGPRAEELAGLAKLKNYGVCVFRWSHIGGPALRGVAGRHLNSPDHTTAHTWTMTFCVLVGQRSWAFFPASPPPQRGSAMRSVLSSGVSELTRRPGPSNRTWRGGELCASAPIQTRTSASLAGDARGGGYEWARVTCWCLSSGVEWVGCLGVGNYPVRCLTYAISPSNYL